MHKSQQDPRNQRQTKNHCAPMLRSWGWRAVILGVALLGVLRVTGGFEVIMVDGHSMSPTLENGDLIVVAPLPFGVSDAVVAKLDDGTSVVKRVISLETGQVDLMGDNPLSEHYVVDSSAVVGRQLLPALPMHLALQDRSTSADVDDSRRVSRTGVETYCRNRWIYVKEPNRRARRICRGDIASWVGNLLLVRSEGRQYLVNPHNRKAVEIGGYGTPTAYQEDRDTVLFEDRRGVWKADGSLQRRLLWPGWITGQNTESVEGLRVAGGTVEYLRYNFANGLTDIVERVPRALARVDNEIDVVGLVESGQCHIDILPPFADALELFDGDVVDNPGDHLAAGWEDEVEDEDLSVAFTFDTPPTVSAVETFGSGFQDVSEVIATDSDGHEWEAVNVTPETAPLALYRWVFDRPVDTKTLTVYVSDWRVSTEIRLLTPGRPISRS